MNKGGGGIINISLFQTYNMKSNNDEFSLSKCVQSFYSA